MDTAAPPVAKPEDEAVVMSRMNDGVFLGDRGNGGAKDEFSEINDGDGDMDDVCGDREVSDGEKPGCVEDADDDAVCRCG